MAQKTKISKDRKIILRFLRLFPEYREIEETIRKQNEAQILSAAIIRSNKVDMDNLQRKIVSDSNLIESLNRYIAALEGRAVHQADLLKDLKRRLKELIARPKNRSRKKSLTM
jgi:hypothetical protein